MAIMMGRTVCITNPLAAFVRDTKLRVARALGATPDGPPAYPPISAGLICTGTPGAGSYFPQTLCADAATAQSDDWLTGHGAQAVLVRPDRYVFGTGTTADLVANWRKAISPA